MMEDDVIEGPANHSAVPLQSTSENSPEVSIGGDKGMMTSSGLLGLPQDRCSFMPRVVIRHRSKGSKKAQKRIRKNSQQNKILLVEFQNNPIWQKSKIFEL